MSQSSISVQSKDRQTWIFQANPKKYRIRESLKVETEELWNLNQHTRAVSIGDRVLIWICGSDAGIYAVGTIVSPTIIRPDTPVGMAYWLEPSQGKRVVARVIVRYDQVLLDWPLLKVFLQTDPTLWDLSILRQPRGTNFVVTETQWQAIQEWMSSS